MNTRKYKELTCVRISTNKIEYVALIDGGSNCSTITEGLVKALGYKKLIKYERIKARSWNDTETYFKGRIQLECHIGDVSFKQEFLVAEKMATGTPALLGMDFLRANNANIDYKPEEVSFLINNAKIPLTKASTKFYSTNLLKIYTAKIENETLIAKACEYRKIEPYMSVVVRITLPDNDWPEQVCLEHHEIKPGLLVESQMVTVRRHGPTPKSKCLKRCQKQCASSCPTKSYWHAQAMVFNSTDKTLYVVPESNIATVEPQYIHKQLTEQLDTTINSIMKDVQKVKKEFNFMEEERAVRQSLTI